MPDSWQAEWTIKVCPDCGAFCGYPGWTSACPNDHGGGYHGHAVSTQAVPKSALLTAQAEAEKWMAKCAKRTHEMGQQAIAAKKLEAEAAELRERLRKVEPILVAADRVHEAYEAMLEGRDIGRLADWDVGQ